MSVFSMDLSEDETYLQKHQSKAMTVNEKKLNKNDIDLIIMQLKNKFAFL